MKDTERKDKIKEEELDKVNGGVCIGQAEADEDGQTILDKWGNNTLDLEDGEFIRKF